jgi:hypothetical protein
MNMMVKSGAAAAALATSTAVASPMPAPPPAAIAIPIAPDPIFAAIAKHRSLWTKYCGAICKFEEDQAQAKKDGRKPIANLQENLWCATEAEEKALWALTKLKPTTAAGAGALVDYVCSDLKDGKSEWQLRALANAARALRGMEA